MGLLDDVLASDAAVFADTDGFGESVTYTPFGGAARTITVVPFRGVPILPGGSPAGSTLDLIIEVRNHATLGILPGSLKLRGDKITIAARLGETATDRIIVELLEQDSGMLRLRLG